ncbi:MAG: hypothetical protein FWF81_09480 [Defluviitaleaceae bacterium]|nr:hypothetical protein [Defluviitaleaceae bacterium]
MSETYMNESYDKYTKILHTLFEEDFMASYRDANTKKRRKLLPYLQAIHRRWYYATLAEHTPFSPANLFECISAYYGEETDKYPIATLRTPSKVTGIDMKVLSYKIESHPVVADFRLLMNYCTPHIDLYEDNCFTDEDALKVAKILSIPDPHYASYLLELAVFTKMFTKMPSLYVQRMKPSKKSEEILSLSDEELLHSIINATISLAAFGLSTSMPMPEHIFTESFVRSLLNNPTETDEIFARVFDVMGLEIEDLMEIGNEEIMDAMDAFGIDMELLSSTFVMGIVLDRFFFTPFGHFLRIIRPLYALPFAFSDELGDYVSVCEDPEEAFVAFFAPCSSYTLTDLGLNILNIEKNEQNYFDAGELQFENMKNSIFLDSQTMRTFIEMAKHLSPLAFSGEIPGEIYTFRVRLESDTSVWLHLQVPDNFSLQNLYDEITEYFGIKNNGYFSFFHDKTENRFAEYPSAKRVAKTKNPKPPADESYLSELDFDHMNHLILVAHNQASMFNQEPPKTRLLLERLNVKDIQMGEMYPQVVRMSKNMKNQLA